MKIDSVDEKTTTVTNTHTYKEDHFYGFACRFAYKCIEKHVGIFWFNDLANLWVFRNIKFAPFVVYMVNFFFFRCNKAMVPHRWLVFNERKKNKFGTPLNGKGLPKQENTITLLALNPFFLFLEYFTVISNFI